MTFYKVVANINLNRLDIVMNGFFLDVDIKKVTEKLKIEVEVLKEGFIVIADLCNWKPASQTGYSCMQNALSGLREYKVGKIIQVLNFTEDVNVVCKYNKETRCANCIPADLENISVVAKNADEIDRILAL